MIATLGEEHAAKGVSARGCRDGFRRECHIGGDSIGWIVACQKKERTCHNDCDDELGGPASSVLHSSPFLPAVEWETARVEPPSIRTAWRSVPRRRTRGKALDTRPDEETGVEPR